MRRLMVKLVAIETALVGWLGYWIFLVYSNNPTISGGLASQLSKFPQLSFTTVDITVLVLISALSVLLAFKFERGLKPGIRLERALQMLESLMKRNLMLEAQVAEMKMANVQGTIFEPPSTSEPELGSWEKAFRTPIEAGPSTSSQPARRVARGMMSETASREASPQHFRSMRFASKPPQAAVTRAPTQFNDRDILGSRQGIDDEAAAEPKRPPSPENLRTWETAPNASSRNQPNPVPSTTARKSSMAIAQPNSRRQPYIPIPAPKAVLPNALQGPGVSPASRTRPVTRSSPATGSVSGSQSGERAQSQSPSLEASVGSSVSSLSPASEITRPTSFGESQSDSDQTLKVDEVLKTNSKTSASVKKRFPWEDE